ncbi:hypothetical protein VHUM_01257 [Vanrija humicola]|uniref:Uncharacterized protein n=1 Tax=Vanrija humicola TaxID=5417 RepID=A0A7D8Z7I0_VANHU|nr:hypothetical protein VHUM_01257 [Vanrija humicola]
MQLALVAVLALLGATNALPAPPTWHVARDGALQLGRAEMPVFAERDDTPAPAPAPDHRRAIG